MIEQEKKNITDARYKEMAYVGVHDLYEDGQVTVFGKSFDRLNNTIAFPIKNLNCISISSDGKSKFYRNNCKNKLAYICERPLNCEQFRKNLPTY